MQKRTNTIKACLAGLPAVGRMHGRFTCRMALQVIVTIVLLLLISQTSIFAQDRHIIDSLENLLLKQADDTSKVNILNDLGFEYLYIDTAKSSYYNQTALKLANRLKYKKGVALSLSHSGHLASLSGKYNEALNYFQKALIIFKETNNRKNTALCYTDIANVYCNLSDYLKCIEQNNLALNIVKPITDKKEIAYIYTSLGDAYRKLGDYPKALKYFFLSLTIYESLNDPNKVASCYNNLAIVYRAQNDLDNALKYYNIAIEFHKSNNNSISLAICYNNVGNVYVQNNKNKEAIEFFNLALQIYKKLGYKYGIATTTNNLAAIYVYQDDYNLAIRLYSEVLAIRNEISDIQGVAVIFNNLSQLYLNLSDTKQAKSYADSSLKIALDIKNLPLMNKAYELLSQIAGKENNFSQAYQYLKLYQTTSDSIFSIEKTREIENIKYSYELDKKEDEITVLGQQNQIQKLKLDKNKYMLISILSILILFFLSGGLIINRQRLKSKKDKQIYLAQKACIETELKNAELEKDKLNEELVSRKKEITNLATGIIEKNNLIKEILVNIKKTQKKDHSSAVKALISSIKIINLNKSRENFYIQVEELHKDFFHILSLKYPDLTQNEKKLAALLRMELSSKDISTLMNISPKSVDMNRYRLRKKLNIDTNIDLPCFLKSI